MRKEKEGRDRVVREEERWVVKGGERQNETKMSHTEREGRGNRSSMTVRVWSDYVAGTRAYGAVDGGMSQDRRSESAVCVTLWPDTPSNRSVQTHISHTM